MRSRIGAMPIFLAFSRASSFSFLEARGKRLSDQFAGAVWGRGAWISVFFGGGWKMCVFFCSCFWPPCRAQFWGPPKGNYEGGPIFGPKYVPQNGSLKLNTFCNRGRWRSEMFRVIVIWRISAVLTIGLFGLVRWMLLSREVDLVLDVYTCAAASQC